jgi:RNA polymerase sigma-70 factor (ECF subfamily)
MGIEELYDKYEKDLSRFARSLTGDKSEAEDLVQVAFLKAITNMQLLYSLPDYKVKSWLFKVIKNGFIDKKRGRKLEVLTEFDEQQYMLPDEHDMDISLLTQEALSMLPEKIRDIVYKRYILDMTSEEIGKSLSIPPSTVRYHLMSAINLLKEKYKNI